MSETEQLRGLDFLAPVDVTIEDKVAMRAYVQRAIDDDRLRKTTRRYAALGLLAPDVDVRALLIAVMDEELVGYYDPKERRLAVRADVAQALGAAHHADHDLPWRATVVHELVHALQDQHFALGARIDEQRTTDADNAFGALVEGDATLVMLAYSAQAIGETLASLTAQPARVLQLMTRDADQLTGALQNAPALLREPLLFRYREGAQYCAELFRRGGWRAVDAAHRDPPTTTLAIENTRTSVRASASISDPEPFAWLESRGYTVVDRDQLGALELGLALAPVPLRRAVSDGWREDSYVVLERDDVLASLWLVAFSSAHAAAEAGRAFRGLRDAARQVAVEGTRVIVGRNLDGVTFTEAVKRARAWRLGTNERAHARLAQKLRLGRGDPLASAPRQH